MITTILVKGTLNVLCNNNNNNNRLCSLDAFFFKNHFPVIKFHISMCFSHDGPSSLFAFICVKKFSEFSEHIFILLYNRAEILYSELKMYIKKKKDRAFLQIFLSRVLCWERKKNHYQ